MADTVKKSRIVSEDDNLEESLMEEFNLRLKNCMSQDKLEELCQDNPDIVIDDDNVDDRVAEDDHRNEAIIIYENVETIRRNGNLNNRECTEEFLKTERENHYEIIGDDKTDDELDDIDLVTTDLDVPDKCQKDLDHVDNVQDDVEDENIYENIRQEPIVIESTLIDGAISSCNEELSTTSDVTDNINVVTINEPIELRKDEETSYELRLEMVADDDDAVLVNDDTTKSAKSRMFLSTDDTSCLLFTQTVTSPMLTPSEENIDFLKGFKCQSIQNTQSDNTSPKSEDDELPIEDELNKSNNCTENIYENVDGDDEDDEENVYENLDDYREQKKVPDLVMSHYDVPQSLKQINVDGDDGNDDYEEDTNDLLQQERQEQQEEHYEIIEHDVDKTTEHLNSVIERREHLVEMIINEVPIIKQDEITVKEDYFKEPEVVACTAKKNGDSITTTTTTLNNGDSFYNKSDEDDLLMVEAVNDKAKLSNVELLKSQFLHNENTTISTCQNVVHCETINECKNYDIAKQINKFENISPNSEDLDATTNNYTQLIETVETETVYETTIEGQNGQLLDKSIKKKKSKKSRNHEKENISVSDTNSMPDDCNYNVNVKNLCRSFGDLTKLEDDKYTNGKKMNGSMKMKTKSMYDVRNNDINACGWRKSIENVFGGVSVKQLKSSFSKFDALQKKNVLHVRSNDATKAHDKFNGSQQQQQQLENTTNCKSCDKPVFQMEQIKAERSIWHKNCFRCNECNKQLNVDTYQSHEGTVYCKPHFKSLFAPKAVEDDEEPKPKKHELIIRENQPQELPPDVVRASDKPDLGLEELQSLNVKERFQVFEHYQDDQARNVNSPSPVNVKKSQTILSKLAKFQAKGMDIGVTDESLNGIPIEESSDEEEQDEDEVEGEDADLVRAKRAQKEKPFHFTQMNDVKSKWENVEQNSKDERREERKQEIQSIRNRLFMGKQGKMKEMYQQAVMDSETGSKNKKSLDEPIEMKDTRSIKEKFEKGEVYGDEMLKDKDNEDMSVFESGISKKSRSIFLELDANAQKTPQISPMSPVKVSKDNIRKARDVYMNRQQSEDVVRSDDKTDDVEIKTADICERFKFFETYREPEQQRRQFRITPPREGQVKSESPEREIYRDPDIIRSEEFVEDSIVAKQNQTATKMLSKFRQMEENLNRDQAPAGPKPLKRFTPPPEPTRQESSSEGECTDSEEESDDEIDHNNKVCVDADLIEAQKAARAKQLRAKFEKWEANEIKREQNDASAVNNIETTKILRERFESMREQKTESNRPRVKVNRFVNDITPTMPIECCEGCKNKVYPLEKITVHGHIFHKRCFKCMECNTILRMNTYSYNQGLLYCIPHFKRLFISKGNYDTAFGLEQHKEKWNNNNNSTTLA